VNKPVPSHLESKRDVLAKMRNEFQFWYPVDMRSSGKDLIPNHLTYFIYNHCAIWDQESDKWPRSIRANGHLLLNSEKMSKSTGNFLTLLEAINKYSADGMRMTLADAGDTVEDANFVEAVAEANLLRLYAFYEWCKEMVENKTTMRAEASPLDTYADRVFESEINKTIQVTRKHYDHMMYKEALKSGFYEFQSARDRYREICSESLHAGLIFRFIETQLIILSPICPHICDYIWQKVLNKPHSILKTLWPTCGLADETLLDSSAFFMDAVHDFRNRQKTFSIAKSKSKDKSAANEQTHPTKGSIFVAKTYPRWQQIVLDTLKSMYSVGNCFPDNKTISVELGKKEELKKFQKKVMPFVAFLKEQVQKKGLNCLNQTLDFDELEVLKTNAKYLQATLQLNEFTIQYTTDVPADKASLNFEDVTPAKPLIFYE
jgi:leucyl-tRNA synthetase